MVFINNLLKFTFRCEVWWIDARQTYGDGVEDMILSNCTITCPQVSRGRSLQGRNAPQDRPSPIRLYKLQCEVEKKEDKGNWSWCASHENHYTKALRRVALVYLICLSVSSLHLHQLYQIGSIFRCQLIKAVKSCLTKVFAKIR